MKRARVGRAGGQILGRWAGQAFQDDPSRAIGNAPGVAERQVELAVKSDRKGVLILAQGLRDIQSQGLIRRHDPGVTDALQLQDAQAGGLTSRRHQLEGARGRGIIEQHRR